MITPTGLCRITRTRWQVLTDYEFLLDERVHEKACQVLSQQAHASGKFVVFWGSLFLVWVMVECILKAIMYLYYNNCDCY
jgi:quinol-cytochrome oxidoreductase complex cytochrome b subunit